ADRNRSHWSTSKTPSYTKSVSWQHYRGTPLQCIYPSVLIQKYLEKMPAMPSGQIAYMWN
ncbi:hypothetical protein OFN18_21975, partial [Escherichia coli]|nr:hypothetical protein [Escherichia coli]